MPRIPRANHASAPIEIKNCRDFNASNMSGRITGTAGLSARLDAGRLSGSDLAVFQTDAPDIRYVVRSYDTPIAWKTVSGRWHIVRQRFSVSTSKHQGRLYMIPRDLGATPSTEPPAVYAAGMAAMIEASA